MRIAVPYDNGNIAQHFSDAAQFKLYDIKSHEIASQVVVNIPDENVMKKVQALVDFKVDCVICWAATSMAIRYMLEASIMTYAGVSLKADEAIEQLLEGTLKYNPILTLAEQRMYLNSLEPDEGCASCNGSCESCEGGCGHDHEHGEGCHHHEHGDGEGCCHHGGKHE